MKIETPVGPLDLPDSVRTLKNVQSIVKTYTTERGLPARLVIEVRWDDSCRNGENSFAVTANESEYENGRWRETQGGCLHELIAQQAPELAHAIPYHLFSAKGPMHYFANTVFLAGDKDCWGSAKGDHQIGRRDNLPLWQLPVSPFTVKTGVEQPAPYVVLFEPVLAKGKERELASARRCADWPEATDQQLSGSAFELTQLLKEQRPDLTETEVKNTVYLAGDRDYTGRAAGEQQQDKHGLLQWRMTSSPFSYVNSRTKPAPHVIQYSPILGKGKSRELDSARKAACWPHATDEDLCLPRTSLEKLLSARLPGLMAEFKAVIEALGFVY